ncbi:MAG: glycosyltransferase, partial [Thermoguttaceae bacterium]|nr:glycosyltransferase [Thermoguttaceae bacterium]
YRGRVILHWHSDILSQKLLLRLYRPLQSWLIRRADRILGTTPVYVRESPWLQGAQDKVGFVPIGIEPIIFEENAVSEYRNHYPGKKIVVSLGRLIPYKGFSTLIEAANRLGEGYQVLIGGMGPLRDDLQQQIDSLGLQERVQLLGYVADETLPALYGACDVFVLSSVMKTEASLRPAKRRKKKEPKPRRQKPRPRKRQARIKRIKNPRPGRRISQFTGTMLPAPFLKAPSLRGLVSASETGGVS